MDEKTLRGRLYELAEIMTSLPTPAGPGMPSGVYRSHIPVPATQEVDELLDHLRLRAKYVTFDLEATRRENRYLRRMLQRRANGGEDPDSP
ncbi:hypothetical protein LCGC14_1956820 [marine sediment metagenome]|uniref:Uncharacterized protein n=1 Tax=marine sediment metagenome TaxID=412755 RepID=A0A0F9FFP8_9ZZZZ